MASRCASASFASFVASRWRWVAVWLPAPGRVRWLGLGWVPSTFAGAIAKKSKLSIACRGRLLDCQYFDTIPFK